MKRYVKALMLILVCLTVLIPLASSNPDGLEKVAETVGIEETESITTGLMPDYTVPTIENSYASTLAAGVLGVFLVLGATVLFGTVIAKSKK
jgi:hypothetical protein